VNDKNKNLLVRLTTGVLLLPAVLFLLYKGGWWAGALLGFAAAACTQEYIQITLKQMRPIGWFAVLCSGLLPLLPVWRPVEATALFCAVLGVLCFAAWAFHLFWGPLEEAPVRAAHVITAAVYAGGGATSLTAIRQLPDGLWWVVAALVVTWGNDTSAYFAGRFLGRHKLYVAVSPNKTWEGFFGGMVGAIAFLFGLRAFFFPTMTVLDCLVIGIAGSVLGPVGDLCESMLKRAYGVKDSGFIIPGHGGMLDRIDALLFNAPMVFVYVQFLR
jgi:phosphatidate cytidylyltransferase